MVCCMCDNSKYLYEVPRYNKTYSLCPIHYNMLEKNNKNDYSKPVIDLFDNYIINMNLSNEIQNTKLQIINFDFEMKNLVNSIKVDNSRIYKYSVLCAMVDYILTNNLHISTKIDVTINNYYFIDLFRSYFEYDMSVLEHNFKSKKSNVKSKFLQDYDLISKNFSITKMRNLFYQKMHENPISKLIGDPYFGSNGLIGSRKKSDYATLVWFEKPSNGCSDIEFLVNMKFICLNVIQQCINKNESYNKINIYSRIGQQTFRKNLIMTHKSKCQICQEDFEKVLIASHIKPWAKCENISEKLDVNNGLLLCSNHDKLFDQGYITYDLQNKKFIYNKDVSHTLISSLILKSELEFNNYEKAKSFIEYHNKYVFKNS